MIQDSIQQKFITIVNSCAPNRVAPKYRKEILADIKGDI